MNPNYESEMADYATRAWLEALGEAARDFDEAMDQLKRVATDFSEGSQQRFMLAMRDASRARDHLWYLEQKAIPKSWLI